MKNCFSHTFSAGVDYRWKLLQFHRECHDHQLKPQKITSTSSNWYQHTQRLYRISLINFFLLFPWACAPFINQWKRNCYGFLFYFWSNWIINSCKMNFTRVSIFITSAHENNVSTMRHKINNIQTNETKTKKVKFRRTQIRKNYHWQHMFSTTILFFFVSFFLSFAIIIWSNNAGCLLDNGCMATESQTIRNQNYIRKTDLVGQMACENLAIRTTNEWIRFV